MNYYTLIRHGQTDWNKLTLIQGHIDNPLNETGRFQAVEASKKILNEEKYDIIISSPLKRAYETAVIIRDKLDYKLDIVVLEGLIERDFGELEGGFVCQENYQKIFDESALGLEKLRDLQNRAVNTIKQIENEYPNKRILITTHSHFIKGLISAINDEFDFTYNLKNSSLNNFTSENGNIKLIEYDK